MSFAKFPYEYKFINGRDGDPSVYVFLPRTGDGLFFDLGLIDNLSNSEVLKASHVFVSHTHIDHFIGFDRLLRVNIPHRRLVHLYGPKGLIANVSGKLQGFLWNLLDEGQIQFCVTEIHGNGERIKARISSSNQFKPVVETVPQQGPIIKLDDDSSVSAVVLDHGTPVLSYKLETPVRYHVNADALSALQLNPGPWIRELQIALRDNKSFEMTQGGRTYTRDKLFEKIIILQIPMSLVYITDIAFSESNLKSLHEGFAKTNLLIIETNYKDEDRAKAFQKKHLTTKQAALIGSMLHAEAIESFHLSKIYVSDYESSIRETQNFFRSFKGLASADLQDIISAELKN